MTDQPRGADHPVPGEDPFGRPAQPGVEHTQEIPTQPTQELPRPDAAAYSAPHSTSASAGSTAYGAASTPSAPGHDAAGPVWVTTPGAGSRPVYGDPRQPYQPYQPPVLPAYATTPKPPRRRGWVLPVGLGAAALLVAGGLGLASCNANGTDYGLSGTVSHPTSDLGTNTEAPVQQGSAVAPDWEKTAAAVSPSVVSIDISSGRGEGQGSGVIIDKDGRIVTNNHVASGAGSDAKISVTLSDQRAYAAKVVGTDPATDLAVIQIQDAPDDLHPIAFGDSGKLRVGQPVMAVGNPLGLSGTVTTGIVSALNRPVTTQATTNQEQQQSPWGNGYGGRPSGATDVFTNAIQTSAAINPGNSGGALVDAGGRLIGINSSIASLGAEGSGQSGNIGIGFAIPVNEVTNIAKQLIATGKAEHAYLGVSAVTGIAKDGSGQREAAIVREVLRDTAAAKAGLRAGDAIIALDGLPITGQKALISQVYGKSVGDTATVDYIRDGRRAQVKITFGQRPAS